jgi:putative SOS response-associated peptidase YedK
VHARERVSRRSPLNERKRSLYPAHVRESHPKRRTLRYANRDEMARRSVSPGIWENWREPASAEIRTFAIITIDSNELVAEIHDRMQVILAPSDYAR